MELVFAFAADGFVDNVRANGDALFHLFFFDAGRDGAAVSGKGVSFGLF